MNTLFQTIKDNSVIATKENVRTPMTPEAVKALKAKLKAQMCMNVYPNQFDTKRPYKVTTRYNQEFFNHGAFVNLEVAKMVGNIASLSLFGRKAMASRILDMDKVQQDPEMIAWMEDERNVETIAQAEAVYA